MESYKHENGSGVFIQVGAGAGDLDKSTMRNGVMRDGFTDFVKGLPRDRINKIILVEPNPLNIPLLKECWKDYPESVIYEIGIVPKIYEGSTIDFYYCPSDGPHYQVASIMKNHIYKHYGENCELNKFVIPVMYIKDFLTQVTSDEIELLSLDIEGIDAEILLDIDFNALQLKYLSFEQLHLGRDRANVIRHLNDSNYKFLGLGVDHNGYDYLFVNGRLV